MENNRITTICQLTPIKFWRWGKIGSLFLIGKTGTLHPIYVIRLVKTLDKIWCSQRQFNPLSMCEYVQKTSQDIVLRGFGAFLFDLTDLKDIKPDTIYLLWKQYCDLVQEENCSFPFNSLYQAAKECLFWSQRDNQILKKFLKVSALSEIQRAIILVCNYECKQSKENLHNLVFNTHPIIAVRKEHNNTFVRYDNQKLIEYKYLEEMDATLIPEVEVNVIARGFQAAFINYCMAKNVFNQINTFTPFQPMIESFLPKYANVSFESVPFHCLDTDVNELYDTYLNYIEKEETAICERDSNFRDIQQKRNFVLHRIFENEVFFFEQPTLTQYYLSELQLHFLEEQTKNFLKYLLGLTQNYEFTKDLKRLNDLFPSQPIVSVLEVESLLTIPVPHKYNAVVQYVIDRRKIDPKFAEELDKCKDRKERCVYLSQVFGWTLDSNALGKNVNAKIRKKLDTGKL